MTLQEYVSGGGRLNFEVHRKLVDALAGSMSADERADGAVRARYDYDTLADGGDPIPGRHLTPEQRAEAMQATEFLADYLEAPRSTDFDAAIRAALPEPLGLHLDAQVHPHRVRVGTPDGEDYWSCDNCGATFAAGEVDAMLITDRPGHSSLRRDIVICGTCVVEVIAELGLDSDRVR